MRATTFAEYLDYQNRRRAMRHDELYLGVEPDGYFGETSLSEPAFGSDEDVTGEQA